MTAGAAVALLYAPETGAKTRRKIKGHIGNAGDYLEDAGDYLKGKAETFSSEAQSYINKGKKQVSNLAESDTVASLSRTAKSLV